MSVYSSRHLAEGLCVHVTWCRLVCSVQIVRVIFVPTMTTVADANNGHIMQELEMYFQEINWNSLFFF